MVEKKGDKGSTVYSRGDLLVNRNLLKQQAIVAKKRTDKVRDEDNQNKILGKDKLEELTETVADKEVETISITLDKTTLDDDLIKEYSKAFEVSIVDITKFIPGFEKLTESKIIDLKPILVYSNGRLFEVPDSLLFGAGSVIKNSSSFGQLCAQVAAEILSKHDISNTVYNLVEKEIGSQLHRPRNLEGLKIAELTAIYHKRHMVITQNEIDHLLARTSIRNGNAHPEGIAIDHSSCIASHTKLLVYNLLFEHSMRRITTKRLEFERIRADYQRNGIFLMIPQNIEASKLIRMRDERLEIIPAQIGEIIEPLELIMYTLTTTMMSKCAIKADTSNKITTNYKQNFSQSFTSSDVVRNVLSELPSPSIPTLVAYIIAHISPMTGMRIIFDLADNVVRPKDIVSALMIYAYIPRVAIDDESYSMVLAI